MVKFGSNLDFFLFVKNFQKSWKIQKKMENPKKNGFFYVSANLSFRVNFSHFLGNWSECGGRATVLRKKRKSETEGQRERERAWMPKRHIFLLCLSMLMCINVLVRVYIMFMQSMQSPYVDRMLHCYILCIYVVWRSENRWIESNIKGSRLTEAWKRVTTRVIQHIQYTRTQARVTTSTQKHDHAQAPRCGDIVDSLCLPLALTDGSRSKPSVEMFCHATPTQRRTRHDTSMLLLSISHRDWIGYTWNVFHGMSPLVALIKTSTKANGVRSRIVATDASATKWTPDNDIVLASACCVREYTARWPRPRPRQHRMDKNNCRTM